MKRWKQFFTPVKSFNPEEARKYMASRPLEDFTILDVRQPKEYEAGHIPGAKLIPLPDLNDRIKEIDSKKDAIVYCAVGGRSRVAAQLLAGQGFESVYNLSGGFKAWQGESAFGKEDQVFELFTGNELPEEALMVAYSLEEGLGDFYTSMIPRVKNDDVKNLFEKLSSIEEKHKSQVFQQYIEITKKSLTQEDFENNLISKAVEGGLTTDEYVKLFHPDWESETDILGLAMSIEAQAMDLYLRAAYKAGDSKSKELLLQIASEERKHLKLLGGLIESI